MTLTEVRWTASDHVHYMERDLKLIRRLAEVYRRELPGVLWKVHYREPR